MKNIVIPESVMYINDVAFANCFYLDEVVISNPKILFADYVFLSDYTSNGILTTDEWIEKCINLMKAMLTE